VSGLAVGVDGCRGGWVVAEGAVGDAPHSLRVVPRFAEVMDVAERGGVVSVAVDMPIGLTDTGFRACDREARRILGPRRASVFPAPARSVLESLSYADACRHSRTASGRALSMQTWNLVPKIADVDARMTPALQALVVEAHPEGAFAEVAGRPCRWPKRSPAGRAEREGLLALVFPDWKPPAGGLPGAAADDILDAAILLWTAARRSRGEAVWVGDDDVDARGLRMRIWR
jgi:predicted RNase H-like nuclease